jgi:polysaccharide biosynthesis protein PslH
MNRLRVLIIVDQVPFFPGPGGTTRLFCLARELAQNHEITLLIPGKIDLESEKIRVLSSFCKVRIAEPNPRLQTRRAGGFFWRLFWKVNSFIPLLNKVTYELFGPPVLVKEGKDAIVALEEEIKKIDFSQYDLVQVEHSLLANILKRNRLPLPVLVAWHNVHSAILKREYLNTKKVARFLHYVQWQKMLQYEKQIIALADHMIVTSAVDKQRLLEINSRAEITVVQNGVDCAYFSNPEPACFEPGTMIFTGLMDYGPNIAAVTYFCDEVLPGILKVYPDCKLIIVGANPTGEVKRLVGRFPGIVNVTGSVIDVRPYLQRAAISIVPLKNGGGTRLKILEAMSMQKAVISTSVGCEGLNLTDGKNIMIADAPGAFAEKVIQFFSDAGICNNIAANGYEFVRENYDWKIIAQRQAAVWEQIHATNLHPKI